MRIRSVICTVLAALGVQGTSWAQDVGSWTVSTGVYPMQPKADSGSPLEIGRATAFAVSGSYLMTPHPALELL